MAGPNGSGKSNTVFRILEELMSAGIPFLVIEPAKGEYKNVFGRDPGVRVYGTNSRKSQLLHLNPFWFNEDVDVLEHIDKLIDVFNASWPMYAAMPAVLKAAIEGAYRSCGWNLKKSACRGSRRIFPTVEDVLAEFNNKMNSTAFSEEVKGNYVGALSTRLESLCNGIYGEIFSGRNLTDEELFGSNVIVDLSRVGAAETKSMIMGMLIIRLQEYRMSGEAMNLPLQHITVLEEAHHLLRRTSTAQSEDGSNMLGKSVEMISNAIAEMRSYGEGFVIVDQSPGLMDMSVMRNTNTKMILRLPEAGDREMVGNTMGLTSDQINELAQLKTGVCAIYQKDWLEPVLCQVDRAKHNEQLYRYHPGEDREDRDRVRLIRHLIAAELNREEAPREEAEQWVMACGISGRTKKKLLQEMSRENPDLALRRCLAQELLALAEELPDPLNRENARQWLEELLEAMADTWDREEAQLLVRTHIAQKAAQEEAWQTLSRLLPGLIPVDDQALRLSRGRAMERICPLHGRQLPLGQGQRRELEGDCLTLGTGEESDRQLAGLLRQFLDTGAVRKRRTLSPYTDIAWQLMGAEEAWDRLYPLLEQKDLDGWDSQAREILSQRVEADRSTQTSILGLFLQKRGTTSAVREIFLQWQMAALGGKKLSESSGTL